MKIFFTLVSLSALLFQALPVVASAEISPKHRSLLAPKVEIAIADYQEDTVVLRKFKMRDPKHIYIQYVDGIDITAKIYLTPLALNLSSEGKAILLQVLKNAWREDGGTYGYFDYEGSDGIRVMRLPGVGH
jgi:hypothetical protein